MALRRPGRQQNQLFATNIRRQKRARGAGGAAAVPQVDIKTIPSLRTRGFGENELEAALRDAVTCHERAWLITSPPRQAQEDPGNKVQEWFQYNWLTFDTRVFNGITVYGISFNGQPNCWYPSPDHTQLTEFENGLQFWQTPSEWQSANGLLHVFNAPGIGLPIDKRYCDAEIIFGLKLADLRGAAWVLRAEKIAGAAASSWVRHWPIWLGWMPCSAASSLSGRRPFSASRATCALYSAE